MTFDVPQDMAIDPESTPLATIVTSCGDIVVELDPGAAPATVNSFVFLAESGYFDGTVAHRVLPGFVIQMGDPTGTGTGSPGYVIPDELPPPGTVYATGTVAMANAGPGTSGSQFFVTLSDVGLPADYTIFGHVVDSADTLDAAAAVAARSQHPGGGQCPAGDRLHRVGDHRALSLRPASAPPRRRVPAVTLRRNAHSSSERKQRSSI